MKTFTCTLQYDFPMLLGTAGRLAELARCYPDTTGTLEMGTRRADIANPFKLMTMGIRKGDRVTVSVDGPSEVELFDVLCDHFSTAM
jgi:phosphotransferase system HPr-like phosphotransfer protein